MVLHRPVEMARVIGNHLAIGSHLRVVLEIRLRGCSLKRANKHASFVAWFGEAFTPSGGRTQCGLLGAELV
jgi:hypothetical protein